ncbi:hypothetical protein FQA39_LY06085 [Lamprigera yunnana]|nr:hypothetical protein FQA39_LY06085 [Lamprigera yunnana]
MRFLLVLSYLTIVMCYLTIPEEKFKTKTCITDILKSVSTETTVVYVYKKVFEDILPEKLENPRLTIDISKKIHRNSKYKIYDEIVILNLKNASLLQKYLRVLKENGLWNLNTSFRRRYLILYPLEKASDLKDIFSYFFKSYLINVIVIAHDLNRETRIFTWDPYHPSNKCGAEFIYVKTHSNSSLFKLRTNKKTQRFNKCNFTFDYYSKRKIDRKNTRVAYIAGFILDEVSKNMNVTVLLKHAQRPYGGEQQIMFGTQIGSHSIKPMQKIVSIFLEAGLIDYKASEFNKYFKRFEYKYKVLSYLTIVTCYLRITEDKFNAKPCIKDVLESVGTETTVVYVYEKVFEDILPKKLEHPLLTIDISKKIHPNSKYKIYNEIVILNLKNASLIQKYLTVLEENGLWNLKSSFRRRYLILYPLKKASELKDIFTYFFKFHVIDIAIMAHDLNGHTKIFTWDPYHPSNRCGTEFNMQTHSSDGLFKQSTNKKKQQFNKCNCTFLYDTNRQQVRNKTRKAYTAGFILDEIVNKTHVLSWDNYTKSLFNQTVLEYNSVFVKEELLQEQIVNLLKRKVKIRVICDDTLIGVNQIMFGTKIGSHLIKPMHKIVSIFLEAGLIDFKASEFNRDNKFEKIYKGDSDNNPKVLSLKHVYPIFVFWGMGLTCATAVFILEHIRHAMDKRSKKDT